MVSVLSDLLQAGDSSHQYDGRVIPAIVRARRKIELQAARPIAGSVAVIHPKLHRRGACHPGVTLPLDRSFEDGRTI